MALKIRKDNDTSRGQSLGNSKTFTDDESTWMSHVFSRALKALCSYRTIEQTKQNVSRQYNRRRNIKTYKI